MDVQQLSQTLSSDLGWYVFFGFVIFLWIYCILWVARDISLRTRSMGLQVGSILLVFLLTPFLGLPIYLLIRPLSYYKDEIRQDALLTEIVVCLCCGQKNGKDFSFCTYCGDRLKLSCKECKQTYATSYEYCPFCGAPNMNVPLLSSSAQ